MAEEIVYNSEVVLDIANTLQENEKIFNDDIKNSLSNDFLPLNELGFTGLTKLKTQANSLVDSHNAFITELKDHDINISEFEDSQNNKIKDMLSYGTFENTENTAETQELDEINLNEVEQNDSIPNTLLDSIVSQFTYVAKKQILKNIRVLDAGSVTELLTDENKSNILVYELKQILSDDVSDLSRFATEEEKKIQKTLVTSLAEEKDNIFKEAEEDTFLRGMPYYKKISDLNNIPIADLILDEKNNNLLNNCIKYVCDHYNIDGMDTSDISSVKNYIEGLAKKSGQTISSFLSDSKNMGIIRGREV